jgi:phospholipid/cholesterol/gamma-HCH transport system substrate-binding protein
MKFSSEAKVGLIGIVTIAVLVWGINYLKGRNILNRSYSLYTLFDDARGLEESAAVMMKGLKVGYVDEITLHTGDTEYVVALLNIEKEYPVREGSVCQLISVDLIGTRAIRIVSPPKGDRLQHNDTVPSAVVPDFLESLQLQFTPVMEKVGSLAVSLDSLALRLDFLMGSEQIAGTLGDLSDISASLKKSLDSGGTLERSFSNVESFTGMLQSQQEEFASLVSHLNAISESLDHASLDELAGGLTSVSRNLDTLLAQVNSGDGTLGRLLYTDTLHRNLETLISDLDLLVKDLNEHPEEYVQFSVFGGNKKKK